MIETSAVLQAGVTILNTTSGETIQIPKTTAHSTAGIVAEAASIGVSDPSFGQASLGAYKYGVMVQLSRELVDDSTVDLQGYLAMETGRALGNAFGAHLIGGTGTGQPRGILTDATLGVTGPRARGCSDRGQPDRPVLLGDRPVPEQPVCVVSDEGHDVRCDPEGEGHDRAVHLWQPSLTGGYPGHVDREADLHRPVHAGDGVGCAFGAVR
jgi:hypothetical protein